jgi:hypothetical protein
VVRTRAAQPKTEILILSVDGRLLACHPWKERQRQQGERRFVTPLVGPYKSGLGELSIHCGGPSGRRRDHLFHSGEESAVSYPRSELSPDRVRSEGGLPKEWGRPYSAANGRHFARGRES